MKKKVVNFRLDEDLYESLLEYAKSRHMTITQILTQIILDFINDKKND